MRGRTKSGGTAEDFETWKENMNNNVVSTLNDLIETCRDGQEGFKEAAENVKSGDLGTLFEEVARERGQFVRELQQEVRKQGGDPDNTGSTAGALHRAWINIKGTLTGKDDQSILNECVRGEDSAVETYREAINAKLPASILTPAETRFKTVSQVHDAIRRLGDAKSAMARR